MDIVNLSEVKSLILKAQTSLAVALHALNTKILIGEINHPETPVEKKVRKKRTRKVKVTEIPPPQGEPLLPDAKKIVRKRRTKKEIALNATAGHIKMDLEKAYQAERYRGIPEPIEPLPDGDAGSTFYTKKKREKKIDGGE